MRNEDGRILLGCVEMADQIACAAASLVDAWIKMILDRRRIYHGQVASLADVWIKMFQHFSGRR